MKALALLLLCLAPAAQATPTRFLGSAGVEERFTERLFTEGHSFLFQDFFKTDEATPGFFLIALLGTQGSHGNNEFSNGAPNSVNMLVWALVLNMTAQETVKYCAHQPTLPFNAYFRAALEPLCAWPAPAAQTEASLLAFWRAVMDYDAPDEEFTAWRDFALTSSFAQKPAAEALPALFFAMVYNPHFLLRK